MMRSFVDEKQNPLLWASTYHAGEFLDPEAVAEAKAKRKAKKLAGKPHSYSKDEVVNSSSVERFDIQPSELISPKQMAVEGYKAQSEMVIDSLDRLITAWEERKESVVVEGVHLSLNFVVCNPEQLLPYLFRLNTLLAIYSIAGFADGANEAGEQLYDAVRNTVPIIDEEYRNQCAANSLSSKCMFQLIQRKGSSRNLMALVNTDGSVAKAWPVDPNDTSGKPLLGPRADNGLGIPMYGPLQIDKAEPVNLQFGFYGISAWPTDGGTSRAGSVDESRADGTDNRRYVSSCCSSPRFSDGPSKEVVWNMIFNFPKYLLANFFLLYKYIPS